MDAQHYPAEQSLTNSERDQLLADIDRDGYVALPYAMPQWMYDEADRVMKGLCDQHRMFEPDTRYINFMNIMELDPIFRRMLLFKPMLQMAYDVFGPMMILQQDQFGVKYGDPEGVSLGSVDWHSDGPETFPLVNGVMPFHTLRFGFLMSDATGEGSGGLEVIPGSHKRPSIYRRHTLAYQPYAGMPQGTDVTTGAIELRYPAGTILAFNTAIMHRALHNRSTLPRRIVYIQFCPSWMRSFHREPMTRSQMQTYSPEVRWLLGEPRPAPDYTWPRPETVARLARFSRQAD